MLNFLIREIIVGRVSLSRYDGIDTKIFYHCGSALSIGKGACAMRRFSVVFEGERKRRSTREGKTKTPLLEQNVEFVHII